MGAPADPQAPHTNAEGGEAKAPETGVLVDAGNEPSILAPVNRWLADEKAPNAYNVDAVDRSLTPLRMSAVAAQSSARRKGDKSGEERTQVPSSYGR